MEEWFWIVIIVVIAICLIGSVFIVMYVLRKGRECDTERGINRPVAGTSKVVTTQGRKWNRILFIYLLVCLIFIIIILYQSVQKEAKRELFDCLVVPVGALFFMIQAISTKNTAIRRERATVHTTATFIMLEVNTQSDSGHRSYHSIFEFCVGKMTYRVCYAGKPDKEKGEQVEIYYAPDDPNIIYVPELERASNKFFFSFLFFYGILFPLVALLAPLFR